MSAWCESLRIKDSDSILVAFAWCDDGEMRLARMFPEYWACDTTFGVTKEQKKLFLCAGLDDEIKTFPLLHCFMPSKLIRAYTWAIKIALPTLLTRNTLSYNCCVSSDSELAIYTPLRSMMDNDIYLNKSCHRLDKYHLFTKPWTETVVMKLGKDETVICMINILKFKISQVFDYVETKDEMHISIRDYETYYNLMKEKIRSDPVCEAIEEIMLSVSNNLKHICHCYFKDVTTFDYLGDSIVEGSNASIKNKKSLLRVSTNISINTSASIQVQISNKQSIKRKR